MPSNVPKYSLKAATFNPNTFEGVVFKPEQEDMSLLANSLSRMEERRRTATEKASAMDVAFGEMRNKLHQDEETLSWFNDFANSYKDRVNGFVQTGDYGNAINAAVKFAGEAVNDPELIGRMKTSEQYKTQDDTQKARINKGISQATYNWWKENNKYKHRNIYDDKGNVVGAEEIQTSVPYDDINFAEHALTAFKMLNPDKDVRSSRSERSSSSYVDGTGGGSTRASGSSRGYERVRKEDILANMDELVNALPGGAARVEQAYDVYKNELKTMNDSLVDLERQLTGLVEGTKEYEDKLKEINDQRQKIEQRTILTSKNGSPISDFKEFYARMVTDELFAKGLAYDWRTTSSESTSRNSSQVTTKTDPNPSPRKTTPGGGEEWYPGMKLPTGETVDGPTVLQSGTNYFESVSNGVSTASGGIENRFGRKR